MVHRAGSPPGAQQLSVPAAAPAPLPQEFLKSLLDMLMPWMGQMQTYDHVVVIVAVAKLRLLPPPSWLSLWFRCSAPHLSGCGPGNLTSLIVALSRLDMQPHDLKELDGWDTWINAYLRQSEAKLVKFTPEELVRTLSALGDLVFRPPSE